MVEKPIVSLSGSPIYRHSERSKPFEFAHGDPELIEAIGGHIERHLGAIRMVFHEVISDLVHIDVHHVAPTSERPCHFLITSGMSAQPMAAPADAPQCRYAELFIALPPDWPVDQRSWENPSWYWPIRALKSHARFPHEVDTWFWYGHTVQQPDLEPYDPSVRFAALALGPSYIAPPDFASLLVSPDREVAFFALHFLYPEELQFKMRHGADALFDRFEARRVTELVSPRRRNTCRRWWAPLLGRA